MDLYANPTNVLKYYVRHKPECNGVALGGDYTPDQCTCGLEKALKALTLAAQPHVQSPTVAQLCGLIKAENNEAGIYMIECPVCLGCKEIAVGMKVTFDFCEPDCWLGNALKAGGVS